MPLRGSIIPFGGGDRDMPDGTLDILPLQSGLIGLGDEGRPRRVGRNAGIQPDREGIAFENLIKPLPEKRRTRVAPSFHGSKHHPVSILAVARGFKIAAQGNLAFRMDGHGIGLPAFDGQFQHPVFAILPEIPHSQRSRLATAPAGIKIHMQDRPIPQPLQGVHVGRIEHRPNLLRREGWGFAAPQPCMTGLGALDPGNRIHRAELFVCQKAIERR